MGNVKKIVKNSHFSKLNKYLCHSHHRLANLKNGIMLFLGSNKFGEYKTKYTKLAKLDLHKSQQQNEMSYAHIRASTPLFQICIY